MTRKPVRAALSPYAGTDAALGGPDLVLALDGLALGVQFAMVGKHQVRRLAQEQVLLSMPMPSLRNPWISSTRLTGSTTTPLPITQTLFFRRIPEGTRCRMYFCPLICTVWPGVIAALRADHDVGLLGQHVNDLAFAFIAPLGANQYRIGHKIRGKALGLCAQTLGPCPPPVNLQPGVCAQALLDILEEPAHLTPAFAMAQPCAPK